MPREKSYNTDELIKMLNQYHIDNPALKITIPNFGAYLRFRGYTIQDYTLRRDNQLREYIDSLNVSDNKKIINDLITYKTIDVDAFLLKNNNRTKLKEAIMIRDKYYSNIASRAVDVIKAKKQLQKKIEELENYIKTLEQEIENANNKIEEMKSESAKHNYKNEVISKMKNILDDYIYPDVANAILKRDGILEVVNNIIDNTVIENKLVKANTNINKENTSDTKYDSVNTLLGGFDE